ncbi:hypothetical protein SOVF_078480 [Spinacia oleracea]|uniref:Uncharacterized protein isoform X2 n=1 Tax=Spinacia oleracea TaxID=3562 RepID=A0ABM3RD68_SPIOL|nr:uncharacterized protein LOC130459068 isoform X2 [Spinacia oleracea]KNA17626.1 hypothetical protein SOVF_078480 [Spinacia oleracea]
MENQLRIDESTRSAVVPEPTYRDPEASVTCEEEEEEEEDEDVEEETAKLEEEVKKIAEKVEKYRSTLPDQLKSCLSSVLSSQRPALSLYKNVSEPGPSSGPHSGAGSSHGDSRIELEAHNDEKTIDEVQLVRDKISSNNSAIPKGLKRMSEYISRIDKVVSLSETVRHSFKRKKKVLERSECISRIDKVVSSSETVRPAYKRKKS